MPRGSRIFGNNLTYHVVCNCNAKEFLFRDREDFKNFLIHLKKCSHQLPFDLHAYCLMHSHVHLMLTTRENVFLDKVMYEICQRFSYRYNRSHCREGHFWKNRYFCKIITNDIYGLLCLRYIHRNPVLAKMVGSPEEWPWSCVHYYLGRKLDPHIQPLPSFLGLAEEASVRLKIYRRWLDTRRLEKDTETFLVTSRIHTNSKTFNKLIEKKVRPIFLAVSGK